MSRTAINQYVKNRTATATPAQLVAMLFDGLILALRRSAEAESSGRREESSSQLVKAQRIVTELRCSLNFEAGTLARELDRIYEFVWQTLVKANVSRDPLLVMRCVELIVPLRDAWAVACLGQSPAQAEERLSA
jgi:flagellar protein FliS